MYPYNLIRAFAVRLQNHFLLNNRRNFESGCAGWFWPLLSTYAPRACFKGHVSIFSALSFAFFPLFLYFCCCFLFVFLLSNSSCPFSLQDIIKKKRKPQGSCIVKERTTIKTTHTQNMACILTTISICIDTDLSQWCRSRSDAAEHVLTFFSKSPEK